MQPRQSLKGCEGHWPMGVSSKGGCSGSDGTRPRELTDSGGTAYPSTKRPCPYFSTALLFFCAYGI
nr:MAG TPA: hypothetical protein [Caudoviricetes sp.]